MGCGRSNINDVAVKTENVSLRSPVDLDSPSQDVNIAQDTTIYYNPLYPNQPQVSNHNPLFIKYTKDALDDSILTSPLKPESRFDEHTEFLQAEASEPVSERSIPSLEGSVAEIKPARMNELELSKKSLIDLSSSPIKEIKKSKGSNSKVNIGNSKILRPKLDDISQLKEDIRKNNTGNSKYQQVGTIVVPSVLNKHLEKLNRNKMRLPPIISTHRNNMFDGRNRFQELHKMMDKLTGSIPPNEGNEYRLEDTQQLIDDIIKDDVDL